ncbi:putative membrane protein, partial [Clostridioides difficile CD51]
MINTYLLNANYFVFMGCVFILKYKLLLKNILY